MSNIRPRRHLDLERRLVWILGSPRSGSTWFASLLTALTGGSGVNEPLIGLHLAPLVPDVFRAPTRAFDDDQIRVADSRRSEHHYFFNDEYRSSWLPALRALLLERFAAQLAETKGRRRGYVIVKEPNGSLGADLLLAATPASRLVFLLRDGRDVVDSQLDAAQPGAWLAKLGGGKPMSARERLTFVEEQAHRWVVGTRIVTEAFNATAPDRRILVRYEDLVAATRPALEPVLGWLGVAIRPDIDQIIAERAFNALPTTGKQEFARSARPGAWRDNLAPAERRLLDAVMAETLTELGYER